MFFFTYIQCSPQPYNQEYDFEKFLSYLMTLTDFPPLVYALQNLKEFSFLTISGWVQFYFLLNHVSVFLYTDSIN